MKKLILVSLILFATAQPVVILVPGTFASTETWWQPGGDFYESLSASARPQGHALVPFCWSCRLDPRSRVLAAECLVRLILSYPDYEPVVLVGHSHGGNVINLASQLLYYARYGPVITRSSLGTKISSSQGDILISTRDERENDVDEQEQILITDAIETLRDEFPLVRSPQKAYPIDQAFLLATPVDTRGYAPNLTIINWVYHLYAEGDLIQQVLGLYNRIYPPHERLTNLCVTAVDAIEAPGHSDVHHPSVGRWLLAVPAYADECEGNGDVVFCKQALEITAVPLLIPDELMESYETDAL